MIGEREQQILPDLPTTNYFIIPKGSLHTSTDLVESLTNLVKGRGDFMNFIIVMKEGTDGSQYIELLEETGGS